MVGDRAADLDRRYVWHPFTQMRDWMASEPLVIARGDGATLEDDRGRRYLDANSSIWTNLHGHNHPDINAALKAQLGKIAHSSALGLANEPAPFLAKRLVQAANEARTPTEPELSKVFFSDDGSTATEVAVKLAFESSRRQGRTRQPRFLSLDNAYHGDTVGSVSVGQVEAFHQSFGPLLFDVDKAMSPHCYRCPYNRAKPERVEARQSRRCHFECVDEVARKMENQRKTQGEPYAAMIVEPRIQGVAGMVAHPEGWLRRVADLARREGTLLIADEVMTGFGRTGPLFASQAESVVPDFLCVAKGMTGGYLPMAATLTTESVFDAFLGDYAALRTFFHGHSYTGNQLGAAASMASLDVLETDHTRRRREELADYLTRSMRRLWRLEAVGDVRQCGLVAGIELSADWRQKRAFAWEAQVGVRVCHEMAKRGVLTRPIGNVVVLMPPYCVTFEEIDRMVEALFIAVQVVLS